MNPQYKIVIFDMDGTFIDSRKFHRQVFYRFFHECVQPVSMEEVDAGIGNTVRDIFQSVHIEENRYKELFSKLDYFCRTQIDGLVKEIGLAPDIHETLDSIRNIGIKTAVVTNSMQSVAERILKIHNLEEKFEFVSGADIESIDKNDRCEAVRKKAAAKKKEVLYAGDSKSDIVLADKMEYAGCFVDTPLSWCEDKEYVISVLKPDHTVKCLSEIVNIIL